METSTLRKLTIGDTDIFLEDFETGRGKITISNVWGHNYSYFWGSMGCPIAEFISKMSDDYFAGKLCNHKHVMDVKGTFQQLRKFIRTELGLDWYKHLEFQKDMREKLNDFQRDCEEYPSQQYFVDSFSSFLDRLDFYLIDDKFDREYLQSDFKTGCSECWYFTSTKPSPEYIWLQKLHGNLKKHFKKELKK